VLSSVTSRSESRQASARQAALPQWKAVAEYAIWESPPPIDSSSHWFLMQIGMILGFATSWPVAAARHQGADCDYLKTDDFGRPSLSDGMQ